MELGFGDINGVFPVKQSKMVHFHLFRLNRRNLSVYFNYFSCYFLNKSNFSAYFSSLFPGDSWRFGNRLIGCLSWYKKCSKHMSPSIFLCWFTCQLLFNLSANYFTKSNDNTYFVLQNRTRYLLWSLFYGTKKHATLDEQRAFSLHDVSTVM